MEGAIKSFVKNGKDDFKSFGDAVINTLIDIQMRAYQRAGADDEIGRGLAFWVISADKAIPSRSVMEPYFLPRATCFPVRRICTSM